MNIDARHLQFCVQKMT